MPTRTIRLPFTVDLAGTLAPLQRGAGDPTMVVGRDRAWRTLRTASGPATLLLMQRSSIEIEASAWGPGADHALTLTPAMVGAGDDEGGFAPRHRVIAELWKHHRGIRISVGGAVVPTLVAAILEQKVTGVEARRAWAKLVRAVGEPAPLPDGATPGATPALMIPPDPARVAELPSFAFHPFGVERRRADVIRAVCADAARIEGLGELPLAEARTRLCAIRGVGPWTTAEVARLALGDADAVSVGDFHLPNTVAWALAGELRGTDERMLELLEPYRGQRGRVQRLLDAGHIHAPRRGPRLEIRSIAGI